MQAVEGRAAPVLAAQLQELAHEAGSVHGGRARGGRAWRFLGICEPEHSKWIAFLNPMSASTYLTCWALIFDDLIPCTLGPCRRGAKLFVAAKRIRNMPQLAVPRGGREAFVVRDDFAGQRRGYICQLRNALQGTKKTERACREKPMQMLDQEEHSMFQKGLRGRVSSKPLLFSAPEEVRPKEREARVFR